MWQIPEGNLSIQTDIVHVWRANLDLPLNEIAKLETILSDDEKLRANRFRFPQHRRRFIAARGILRQLLASYLDVASHCLKFEYSSRGKPRLMDNILEFNISHSQELALYGITCYPKIGIDLEYLREIDDLQKIAQRFFSPKESEFITCLRDNEQRQAFFQLWTAKEAYLKATGEGLTGSLDGVEISITAEPSVTLTSIKGDIQAAANWLMSSFVPATDYIATVAIETTNRSQQIEFWSWN